MDPHTERDRMADDGCPHHQAQPARQGPDLRDVDQGRFERLSRCGLHACKALKVSDEVAPSDVSDGINRLASDREALLSACKTMAKFIASARFGRPIALKEQEWDSIRTAIANAEKP